MRRFLLQREKELFVDMLEALQLDVVSRVIFLALYCYQVVDLAVLLSKPRANEVADVDQAVVDVVWVVLYISMCFEALEQKLLHPVIKSALTLFLQHLTNFAHCHHVLLLSYLANKRVPGRFRHGDRQLLEVIDNCILDDLHVEITIYPTLVERYVLPAIGVLARLVFGAS